VKRKKGYKDACNSEANKRPIQTEKGIQKVCGFLIRVWKGKKKGECISSRAAAVDRLPPENSGVKRGGKKKRGEGIIGVSLALSEDILDWDTSLQ